MKKELLLGAEAIAQGALDAGISGVYAYPGTPSTEITEFIQRAQRDPGEGIRSKWSTNEKTALEAALGMSYAGKRSLVCMKHVGLNVAADPFMNASITGVHGGLTIVVADDPSMHSSQNEQDSRVYGKFAMIPVLEPANQQEAYEMTRYAFDLSEKSRLPVMLRVPTRLSHSRSIVQRGEPKGQNPLDPSMEKEQWILLPANARGNYQRLLDKQEELVTLSEAAPFNWVKRWGDGNSGQGKTATQSSSDITGEITSGITGVIAFGIAYNYAMEVIRAYNLPVEVLKVSTYPLPRKLVNRFIEKHNTLLIAEEGYPVYEELLKGYRGDDALRGRLDGTLPRTGELSPNLLAKALGVETIETKAMPAIVKGRPPMLCPGCGHRDLFHALNEVLASYPNHRVFGDIGCYTLGALPPFNAIHTCVDMGAAITMAKGAADAGMHPAVCVIGDSTFTHSGITGLLDAVNDRSPLTVIISDNETTAMTGGQDSAGTGRFRDICKGIGVEEKHIRTLVPLKRNHEENVRVIRKELEYEGVSVIIAQRECVQTAKRKRKKA
ncbi:MAG: thiamine pyrophosphate-dependent enzyme [Fermentimonas sp.]